LEEGVLEETEGFGGCGGGEFNRHGSTVRGERRKKKKNEEDERSERRENVSVFFLNYNNALGMLQCFSMQWKVL
jgi:hypothetical protein